MEPLNFTLDGFAFPVEPDELDGFTLDAFAWETGVTPEPEPEPVAPLWEFGLSEPGPSPAAVAVAPFWS